MRRYLGIMSLAFIAIVGCGDDNKGTNPQPQTDPGAFQADFRTSSAFFTLMSGMKLGTSPHGKVQIWYSSNARDLLSQANFEVPVGTVAIKPFDQNADGTEDGIAIMIKKEVGYDAPHNDWYYEMRDVSGNVMADPAPGRITMCIGCHAGASAKDYLSGTTLR